MKAIFKFLLENPNDKVRFISTKLVTALAEKWTFQFVFMKNYLWNQFIHLIFIVRYFCWRLEETLTKAFVWLFDLIMHLKIRMGFLRVNNTLQYKSQSQSSNKAQNWCWLLISLGVSMLSFSLLISSGQLVTPSNLSICTPISIGIHTYDVKISLNYIYTFHIVPLFVCVYIID